MTDNELVPTRQAVAAKDRSGKLTVSGKLKVALDLMLYEAASRADSAERAGLKDHSLRAAMRKPHVAAYYRQGLEVLRMSERPKNIFALAKIRDKSENGMAVVAAAKALEQLSEEEAQRRPASGSITMPGLTIQIINAPAPALPSRFPDGHQLTIDDDETYAKSGKTPLLREDGPHD
jgi:hypothetical protein